MCVRVCVLTNTGAAIVGEFVPRTAVARVPGTRLWSAPTDVGARVLNVVAVGCNIECTTRLREA